MGDNLYKRGEQLQLNCSSEGGLELEYTWLLLDDIIPNENTSILTIDNMNTTHAGDYTCNVTNNAGYQSNTVTVYGKLRITLICQLSSLTCYICNMGRSDLPDMYALALGRVYCLCYICYVTLPSC